MIVHDVVQRSAEWRALRLGMFTASRSDDMLATTRSGQWAAGRKNLRVQIVLERVTRRSLDRDFVSAAMQQGIDREEDALTLYEELSGRLVWPVGFVSHDHLKAGCSPDGMVNDFEGLVQAKCPIPATHLEYLRTGKVPLEYERQIRCELWLTGAAWCDFLSFNPDFPEAMRAKVVRLHRDALDLPQFERDAMLFLQEVDLEEAAVRTLADSLGTLQRAVEVA